MNEPNEADILKKMQLLRIHAKDNKGAALESIEREYRDLFNQLNALRDSVVVTRNQ